MVEKYLLSDVLKVPESLTRDELEDLITSTCVQLSYTKSGSVEEYYCIAKLHAWRSIQHLFYLKNLLPVGSWDVKTPLPEDVGKPARASIDTTAK